VFANYTICMAWVGQDFHSSHFAGPHLSRLSRLFKMT
jgi:hypothetical protein